MKKTFIIIVSLFLVFTSFSCVNKKTPTKEEPKQVEKTPEQEPTTPVTPDEKDPVDPSIVTPDEKEPVEPVKPKVKHKITYDASDNVIVDGLPTEYVEGVGIETLPSPKVVYLNLTEEYYEYVFVYWYIKGETIEFSEVVTSISETETRDLVLTPMLVAKFMYENLYGKYIVDMLDKVVYPYIFKGTLETFPYFNTYAHVTITKVAKNLVVRDNKRYYKLYCKVNHIYDYEFLQPDEFIYGGNYSYYKPDEMNEEYFIYMNDSKYRSYKGCKEFIIPINYDASYDIHDDHLDFIAIRLPKSDSPLAVIDLDNALNDYKYNFDFYPIVDNTVYISDQSAFIDSNDKYNIPYIHLTYRNYINKNLSDNPTFEEFDKWLKESMFRLYERAKYNKDGVRG